MYSVAAFCLFLLFGQFVPGSSEQVLFTWRQKVSQAQPFNGFIFESAFPGQSNLTYGFSVDMSLFALDSTRVALENTTLRFGNTTTKLNDLVASSLNEADLQAGSRQYVDPCITPYRTSEGNFSLYGESSYVGSLRGTVGVDLWLLPVHPLKNNDRSFVIDYATMSVPNAPASEHYLNLRARFDKYDSNSTLIIAGGGSCPSKQAGGVYESYVIPVDQELQVSIKVTQQITEYWINCHSAVNLFITWSVTSSPTYSTDPSFVPWVRPVKDWVIALIVVGSVLAAAIIALVAVIGVQK